MSSSNRNIETKKPTLEVKSEYPEFQNLCAGDLEEFITDYHNSYPNEFSPIVELQAENAPQPVVNADAPQFDAFDILDQFHDENAPQPVVNAPQPATCKSAFDLILEQFKAEYAPQPVVNVNAPQPATCKSAFDLLDQFKAENAPQPVMNVNAPQPVLRVNVRFGNNNGKPIIVSKKFLSLRIQKTRGFPFGGDANLPHVSEIWAKFLGNLHDSKQTKTQASVRAPVDKYLLFNFNEFTVANGNFFSLITKFDQSAANTGTFSRSLFKQFGKVVATIQSIRSNASDPIVLTDAIRFTANTSFFRVIDGKLDSTMRFTPDQLLFVIVEFALSVVRAYNMDISYVVDIVNLFRIVETDTVCYLLFFSV